MTTDFTRHAGLAHKVFLAGDQAGFTPAMWNALAESPKIFSEVAQMVRTHMAHIEKKARFVHPSEHLAYLKQVFTEEEILIPAIQAEHVSDFGQIFAHSDQKFPQPMLRSLCKATEETECIVFDQVRDATFMQIFDSIHRPIRELCLTPNQMTEFIRHHEHKLCHGLHGICFLFEQGEEFFIAHVFAHFAELFFVRPLLDKRTWKAEHYHRFVFPKGVRVTPPLCVISSSGECVTEE